MKLPLRATNVARRGNSSDAGRLFASSDLVECGLGRTAGEQQGAGFGLGDPRHLQEHERDAVDEIVVRQLHEDQLVP